MFSFYLHKSGKETKIYFLNKLHLDIQNPSDHPIRSGARHYRGWSRRFAGNTLTLRSCFRPLLEERRLRMRSPARFRGIGRCSAWVWFSVRLGVILLARIAFIRIVIIIIPIRIGKSDSWERGASRLISPWQWKVIKVDRENVFFCWTRSSCPCSWSCVCRIFQGRSEVGRIGIF